MQVGDKVYVIDWGKQYSSIFHFEDGEKKKVFPFVTDIPDYSEIQFHWHYEYEPNLTLKGTVNKRDPRKLVSKTPIYKEFKYEILEILQHPEKDIKVCLIKSVQGCYVTIAESGLSVMTPQEFEDKEFNALINYHLGRWTPDTIDRKNTPKEIVNAVYDTNDNVLFGSNMVKGKVAYNYVEGRFSTDGKPIYLGCTISYDGTGNSDLPEGTVIMKFQDIQKMLNR